MNRVQTRLKKDDSPLKRWMGKKIGIIIPTTTRGLDIKSLDDLPFFKIMLPSFVKSSSGECYYNFYLGYDHDDPFIEKREEIVKKFKDMTNEIYSLDIITFPSNFEKGDLSSMWSYLADKAMEGGNEYLYQLGDDIEVLSSEAWDKIFISKLKKMNNIGSVGPVDINNPNLMTQSFVHCTHLSIFKRYFPKELKNWHIDDWMMEIYDSRTECQIIVRNCGGKERYNIKNMKNIKNKIVSRDKKYVRTICECKHIIKIKCVKNLIFHKDDCLVVCNSNLVDYDLKVDMEISPRDINKLLNYYRRPEISFKIGEIFFHRGGNYISVIEDNITTIVHNIENVTLKETKDDIYLFLQFYISKNKERYEETKECLRRNINLGIFKKIYLLNERIYSRQELGISSKSIIQVNIGKRLTYRDFIEHTKILKGFVVLCNADIFFDDSLEYVRKSVMREIKSVQCLRRYEYRGEKDLLKCIKHINYESSQDCWIFHTSQLSYAHEEYNINLGTPGCDNKIADILRQDGYMLLNNYISIRIYHNHKSPKRNYNRKQLPRPYSYVLNSFPLTSMDEIMRKTGIFWQYPVITEKVFYDQNRNDPDYIGLPWATLIDKKKSLDMEYIKKHIHKNNSYTCCQHIRFRDIIPFLKIIGINKLYTPHKLKGEDRIENIEIKPCPLYAKVIEDDPDYFSSLEGDKRKYIYSFQGGLQPGYMSDIRQEIFKMKHPKGTFIKNTGSWHFNPIVYSDSQNEKGDYNGSPEHFSKEKEYKELLKQSRYTLCPSGTGPNSIRFWEALGAGSIPILLSDKMTLPKHDLWKDAIIRIKEDGLNSIALVLLEIDNERENEMRSNCRILYQYFRKNYKG